MVTLVGDKDCKIKYNSKDAQNTKRHVKKGNKDLLLRVNWQAYHLFYIEDVMGVQGSGDGAVSLPLTKLSKMGLICNDIDQAKGWPLKGSPHTLSGMPRVLGKCVECIEWNNGDNISTSAKMEDTQIQYQEKIK